MISILLIGVVTATVLLTWIVHRGSGPRSVFLRHASAALLVATILREIASADSHPVEDLVKRLALLVLEMNVILLVLTFRRGSITRKAMHTIRWATVAVAVVQIGAWALAYTTGPRRHIPGITAESMSPAATVYYALYLLPFVIAAAVVGIGCARAMRHPRQPVVARVSLGLIVLGAVATTLFILSSLIDLLGWHLSYALDVRGQLFLLGVSAVLAGLAIGGLRTIVVEGQQALAIHAATEIVQPLWSVATNLHPNVILPFDPQAGRPSRQERLIRMVVETHDALGLLSRKTDGLPDGANAVSITKGGPEQIALVLTHLAGRQAVPPPGRATVLLQRATRLQESALAASVASLAQVRAACAAVPGIEPTGRVAHVNTK